MVYASWPGALRSVLPRLYAQAVGHRSERARQVGDRAHPDAHQRRRPLFHRQLPGDAAARLHANVREHARSPADTSMLGTDYREIRAGGRSSTTSSIPARSTNISTSASASCPIAPCSSITRRSTLEQHQPVGGRELSIGDVPYTRISEYKHLTGQRTPKTSICYEYPRPRAIPIIRSRARRTRRSTRSTRRSPTRHRTSPSSDGCATYRYYNMDQVVAQALSAFERLVRPAVSHRREEAGVRRTGRVEATPLPGNLLLSREEAGGGGGG